MKKILMYCIGILSCLAARAQVEKPDFRPLKIGDDIPESVWHMPLQTVNHQDGKKTISLNDYRGKMIVLDFWATWCSSCIQNFPKVEMLQKKLESEIKILAIAYEDKKKITEFFASKVGKDYQIASVVADSVFRKIFPHRLIPHYVWIDKAGKVKMFTGSEELTEENIISVIDKRNVSLIMKNDIDTERPLFLSDYIKVDSLSYFSLLLKGYYPGLGSGSRFRKTDGILRGRAVYNASIKVLYETAAIPLFKEVGDKYNKNRLIIQAVDLSKVLAAKSLQDTIWNSKFRYSYDLIVPKSKSEELFHIMLSELNKYSGYYGRIERRKVKCIVLARIDRGKDLMKTKGSKHENSLFYKAPSKLINYPIGFLVDRLNSEISITKPVIDETGYKNHVDIVLSGNLNLIVLRKELQQYGLDLIESERELDMFVISDHIQK
ncbi:MAG: TlpA family protein disulfide reductase [Chryseobacterium sp.]|nr:MAG: TlpA family protein disulfide reductase [Chryseobacterium sp.]